MDKKNLLALAVLAAVVVVMGLAGGRVVNNNPNSGIAAAAISAPTWWNPVSWFSVSTTPAPIATAPTCTNPSDELQLFADTANSIAQAVASGVKSNFVLPSLANWDSILMASGSKTDSAIQSKAVAVSTCACKTATVSCQGPKTPGYTAECYSTSCRVNLTQDMCDLFHLTNGSKIDPNSLSNLNEHPMPTDKDINKIVNYCTVKHEVNHLCDGSKMPYCQTEQNSYRESGECFQSAYYRDCPDGRKSDYCYYLHLQILHEMAMYKLNECLCNKDSTCQECINQCQNYDYGASRSVGEGGDLQDFCVDGGKSYCKVNGKAFPGVPAPVPQPAPAVAD